MIINYLDKIMIDLVTPGKNLSIDESLMIQRGHLVFCQYIKNKLHKYGISFSELSTHDELILTAEAYDGQGFQTGLKTGVIVLKLMKLYLNI